MSTPHRTVDGAMNTADEEQQLQSLRPQSLGELIGQEQVKERMAFALRAARILHEPLDHVILSGPPGLGKTTLAHIIANELGTTLHRASGPALQNSADLMGLLTSMQDGDVLFIDEIHRLPRVLEEHLYTAMEDFRVDFIMTGPDGRTQAYPIQLPHFTLVGATTRKGMLTQPLRDRFGFDFGLDFYEIGALSQIVSRSALLLGLQIDLDAAKEVAARSRGTPRIANRLLRRIRDYVVVGELVGVEVDTVNRALLVEGIDAHGFDDLDRRYLRILVERYQGSAGLNALAATMQEEAGTLEDVVEPFLLHEGYIIRTQTGRKITNKGLAVVKGRR